ncbi:MAG TPA: cytochrome b/b6 domain-containing protein [Povalibacter sp.]|uniref:cytochrome b/b6 domain-containing protein n=1 Tax=Povalibacter sp. TaxID=1962978 RepID=UPI002CDC6644|nr:cytochrome b/b6 domain-containing protein [Povalibacter sp.]HMN46111.1 cytochrome b/b6 domain-containing protein [Povalibacter sp.]
MSAVPAETAIAADAARASKVSARTVQVWDLPVRLFHWTLVLSIAAAYVTAEFGGSNWADWHGRIGAFVLALLVFRLIWGFIGTPTARFRNFFPTPSRLVAYLRGRWQGRGHNPLGALSVIALLALVAAQVATGLYANDDIAFAGPLSASVGKSTSDALTGWHEQIFYVLAGFIGLHVLAIIFYLLVRRSNLVTPMITGSKVAVNTESAATTKHLGWRFVAAVAIAATASWLVFRAPAASHAEVAVPAAATADW